MDSNKKPIDIEINELSEKSEGSSEQSVENEMELKPSVKMNYLFLTLLICLIMNLSQ